MRFAPIVAGALGAGWITAAAITYRPEGLGLVACPFRHVTGWDCPGCGSTRALGALARFEIGAALDHHVLVPIVVVFAVVSWALWLDATWRRARPRAIVRGPTAVIAIALGLVAFTVFRNTDAGSWFASGLAG